MKKRILSSCEKRIERPKHSGLTQFVRKHGIDNDGIYCLLNIWKKCDIKPHIGFLPPELRELVDKKDISSVTSKFFAELDFLVVDKGEELKHHTEMKYYLTEIGELFNTLCVLETYERMPNLDYAYREWGGVIGDVYKLTFPEIHAAYALKVFKQEVYGYKGHGPFYEIPTAFCANKCEPKRNNPIYMANLFGAQYMLSKWAGEDNVVPLPEDKETTMFQTTYQESHYGNYRNGKRIDFGDTYKTDYGHLSYNARKMFRKMENMRPRQIMKLRERQKDNFSKSDFEKAYALYVEFYGNCR